MVQSGMSCIKYLMFVFNFVFVICGIALISIGVFVHTNPYTYFMDSKYVTAPNILIAVGCIIFILAFFGCCGAVKENHCMVMSFGILLFIIFVVEVAGGIAAYVHRNELEGFLKHSMNSTIHQNRKDTQRVWDEMQRKWECCGVDGASDYGSKVLPMSCCHFHPDDQICTMNSPERYGIGCFGKVLKQLNSGIATVGGVAIGIAVVELIGVMFSCCLAAAIKKEYKGV